MVLAMLVPDMVGDGLVKAVAANSGVALVSDLHQRSAHELAQREIQRAASPVNYERGSILEFRTPALEIRLGSKVAIQSGEWLVNKLMDAKAGLVRRIAQFLARETMHSYGDCNNRALEVDSLHIPLCYFAKYVFAEKLKDFGGYIAGGQRPPRHIDGTPLSKVGLGRAHEVSNYPTLPRAEIFLRFTPHYYVSRAAIPDNRWVRIIAVKKREYVAVLHQRG